MNSLIVKLTLALLIIVSLIIYRSFFYSNINVIAQESATLTNSKRYDSFPIQPLPQNINLASNKVSLGEKLFHEPMLSKDNTISCVTCHDLTKSGTDQRATSIGFQGAVGTVNSPTVFNSNYNFSQFWDGRAKTLEEQASGPIHNPIEMNSNWKEIIDKLQASDNYPQMFESVYPDGITSHNISNAIATFERSLITPNSAFDKYLRGNQSALTKQELNGYQLFNDNGCISCHQGINIGGNMYQKFGIIKNYFENKTINPSDLGRYNVTKNEDDRHVFKVPSLRNVGVTAPYFHDGSEQSLYKTIKIMGEYQLGQTLSDQDTKDLLAFLHTLTGEWQGSRLQ